MKKTVLTFIAILSIFPFIARAQWVTSGTTVTNTGNVGIGTTSPSFPLHIVKSASGATLLMSVQNTGGGVNSIARLLLGTSAASGNPAVGASISTIRTDATTGGDNDLFFSTSAGTTMNEHMRILANGNVGIGTTTPREALSVNGNIRSKQVKVETANWPDYVFKPKYNLPSLAEVKTYIDQNQHLPEMPSEQEIAKDGLNLGEIVKLQTKKIEELTLYLIEKDKEMKAQQDQLNKLSVQLEKLTSAETKK